MDIIYLVVSLCLLVVRLEVVVDVNTTDFFYKAVLWAVENGITNGVDATHFGPTAACNRAQVVTFLYRAYN